MLDKDEKLINTKTAQEGILEMQLDGYCGCSQSIWNIIFASMAVIGQVGQNVILPIWFASAPGSVDPLWILTFNAIAFMLFFGTCVIIFDVIKNKTISNIQQLKQLFHKSLIKKYIMLGVSNASAGLFIIFSARKCAPYLQAILGTFSIFWVLIFRYLLLKKKPTFMQFVYACFVFGGLFLTSVPSIFGLNDSDAFTTDGNAVWKVLWPLLFALGYAPNSILNVTTEAVMKDTFSELPKYEYNIDSPDPIAGNDEEDVPQTPRFSTLSVWWVLFMETMFQWIIWFGFFWVDALPTFGTADDIKGIFDNLNTNWRYFFGLYDGISVRCIYLPLVFNGFFIITLIGYAMMVRYTEGSSWGAIVNCLVSPIGAIFWYIFELNQTTGWFGWKPSWKSYDLYAFAGLALMGPFIYLYNIESSKGKRGKIGH